MAPLHHISFLILILGIFVVDFGEKVYLLELKPPQFLDSCFNSWFPAL